MFLSGIEVLGDDSQDGIYPLPRGERRKNIKKIFLPLFAKALF